MKKTIAFLVAATMLVSMAAVASADGDDDGVRSMSVGDKTYYFTDDGVFEETNQLDGLQQEETASADENGQMYIPPDEKLV